MTRATKVILVRASVGLFALLVATGVVTFAYSLAERAALDRQAFEHCLPCKLQKVYYRYDYAVCECDRGVAGVTLEKVPFETLEVEMK